MNRLTRVIVLVSVTAALGSISYLAYGASPVFPFALVSWLILLLAARRWERWALGIVLLAVYLTPATLMLVIGRNVSTFITLWMGGLLAIMIRTSAASGWSLPRRWRWPLVTVALVIAMSWPVVCWRELDFTVANISNLRLPVAGLKISGTAAAGGVAFTAAIQLLGLLWVDWLWARFSNRQLQFRPAVVAPLAAGIALSCLVGVYQGFVDISFINGHVWPSVRRAVGTHMDANVFGMLAALWGPAFLVLAAGSRRKAGAAAMGVALAFTWAGVWVSGSRTAMLAAALGLLSGLASLRPWLMPAVRSARTFLAVTILIAGLGMVLALVPRTTTNAFERAAHLMPSVSVESIAKTARELWVRDGYGTAAVAMIKQFPLTGVGIGCYSMLAHDFGTEHAFNIPPDNAQNWFRHQLTELGVIGSIGWLGWSGVLLVALWPRHGQVRGAGVALRGSLIGFGLASLLGVPGQEAAVVITFWVFVCWYGLDTGLPEVHDRPVSSTTWVATLALAGGYTIALAVPNDLRPPFRAARFNFPYTYGVDFERPNQVWTAKRGVTVLNAADEWMKITAWVGHPDADAKPVHVDVWRDRDHVINERLSLHDRVTRYVHVGRGQRFVLEAQADRTFRPSESGHSADSRDLGVALSWEFLTSPAR